MSEYVDNKALRKLLLGREVARAASVLPQTVVSPGTPYYTIYGGKVLVTGLVGEIVTANVGGACAVSWFHAPSGAIGTGALLTDATTITTWVVGDILSVSGLLTAVMSPTVHASSGVMLESGGKGILLMPGNLGMISTTSVAGNWKWTLTYIPIDDGAYIRAV